MYEKMTEREREQAVLYRFNSLGIRIAARFGADSIRQVGSVDDVEITFPKRIWDWEIVKVIFAHDGLNENGKNSSNEGPFGFVTGPGSIVIYDDQEYSFVKRRVSYCNLTANPRQRKILLRAASGD